MGKVNHLPIKEKMNIFAECIKYTGNKTLKHREQPRNTRPIRRNIRCRNGSIHCLQQSNRIRMRIFSSLSTGFARILHT